MPHIIQANEVTRALVLEVSTIKGEDTPTSQRGIEVKLLVQLVIGPEKRFDFMQPKIELNEADNDASFQVKVRDEIDRLIRLNGNLLKGPLGEETIVWFAVKATPLFLPV